MNYLLRLELDEELLVLPALLLEPEELEELLPADLLEPEAEDFVPAADLLEAEELEELLELAAERELLLEDELLVLLPEVRRLVLSLPEEVVVLILVSELPLEPTLVLVVVWLPLVEVLLLEVLPEVCCWLLVLLWLRLVVVCWLLLVAVLLPLTSEDLDVPLVLLLELVVLLSFALTALLMSCALKLLPAD